MTSGAVSEARAEAGGAVAGPAAQRFAITPFDAPLGAEVVGIDLARPLAEADFERLHAAWLQRLVLVFREQRLTPAQHVAFSRRLGDLEIHVARQHVLPEQPEIYVLSNVVEAGKPAGKGSTPYWHSDLSYKNPAAKASLLYGREVPEVGGDTLFSNQYLAYEALSPGMKAMLDGLKAVHGTALVYGDKADNYTYVDKLKESRKEAASKENVHPVVRTHPETQRKALFVNDHYTLRFEGMTKEESKPLLQFLFNHAVRPEFTCRFRWQNGSVAFWDNRCSLHTPIDDYFGKRRQMWRITIGGDRPV